MSTPQIGTRNIGGINFLEKEVKSVTRKIKIDPYNSNSLFTVETTHGTFSYRDDLQCIRSGEPRIEGGNIYNCALKELIGTEETDFYLIRNSDVCHLDLSGDKRNADYAFAEDSFIIKKTLDNNDRVTEYVKNKLGK